MANLMDIADWRDFFEKYRDLPVLWKIKSEEYKNKYKKNQAWNALLETYKLIDPKATVPTLKNKISNIRSCYRREAKKVSDSNKSGAGEDDLYVPTLWYFDCLHFLQDQEEEVDSICPIDLCDESNGNTELPILATKRSRSGSNKNTFLKEACSYLKDFTNKSSIETPDEADIFGKSFACSYRNMPAEQKLYAKRAIEEILVLGQLSKLSFESFQSCPSSDRESMSSTPPSSRAPSTFQQRWSSPMLTKLPMFSPSPKIQSAPRMQSAPAIIYVNQQQEDDYAEVFESEICQEPNNRKYSNFPELLQDEQYS